MSASTTNTECGPVTGVPGVYRNTINPYVENLKKYPWTHLLPLLGLKAEHILADLLLHCGIFERVDNCNNLNQICGTPLYDLKLIPQAFRKPQQGLSNSFQRGVGQNKPTSAPQNVRGVSDIRFVRSRILYAKPSLSTRGKVSFGLMPGHLFNRECSDGMECRARLMLMYVFPREFGLHNAFTSEVDRKDTSHQFKDYHIRDDEIVRLRQKWRYRSAQTRALDIRTMPPLPNRLRGPIAAIAAGCLRRQDRLAYFALLNHYCPRPCSQQLDRTQTIRQASHPAQVSAFCRAVLFKVFPNELWGRDQSEAHNKCCVMRSVDRFIRIGRYESLSLHDVLQDIKIRDVTWLTPRNNDDMKPMCATDFSKRKALMAELLYYIFDSFLIPLIRGHFYVTESGAHRNQLFYFRHDVWKALSEPALATVQSDMLEPCSMGFIKSLMTRRALGVSSIRLLPKDHGMRPIINLRRRMPRLRSGQLVLGKSINSAMTPAFSVLSHEKAVNPGLLGSAMFSVEDVFARLQAFRIRLREQNLQGESLFFAKVDVRSCFDSIPQKRLLQVARVVLSSERYNIVKHARGKLIGSHDQATPGFGRKPSWRYLTKAATLGGNVDLRSEAQLGSYEGRTRSVYVDGVVQRCESREAIMKLLEEHVESNLIRLENKFYRQKEGIPQGSIVSSLLCSYFYADMERELLDFINSSNGSVLLRLIDDFLVISTKKSVAEHFLRVMHKGAPEYGVTVKAEKSRANFDCTIDGHGIVAYPSVADFPYCGTAINTVTLDLSRDMDRRLRSSREIPTIECGPLPLTCSQVLWTPRLSSTRRYPARRFIAKYWGTMSPITLLVRQHSH